MDNKIILPETRVRVCGNNYWGQYRTKLDWVQRWFYSSDWQNVPYYYGKGANGSKELAESGIDHLLLHLSESNTRELGATYYPYP